MSRVHLHIASGDTFDDGWLGLLLILTVLNNTKVIGDLLIAGQD
jgi:hypothetical protein